MGGPMEGVQILEVAHWAAVPAATAILSDWGAEVVKIENPDGGDATRGVMGMGIYPFQLEVSPLFEVDNRNKRSVALRLGSEEAEAVLHRLIERADVFATNFEPPVLEKFNLQYDQLSEINPRLIYANLSGYGEEGADKDRPGYDWTTYWARSGIMAVLGEPDAPPVAARPAIGDHPASMLLAGAIAAALFSREKTGVGQKVGAALMHCGMWVLSTDIEASLLSGKPIPRISRKNTGNPLTISYLTKDEKWLLLTMPQADRYWPELCKAVGREDMKDDTRFNSLEKRRDNSTELISILDEIFFTKTREEWGAILDDYGCIWGIVQTTAEIDADAQAWENQFLTRVEHPTLGEIKLVTSPGQFSKTPSQVRKAAPELGQHTEEVLLELGYGWDEIGKLKEKKVIL